jgi:Heterokaryon incompatibility protein (HET)
MLQHAPARHPPSSESTDFLDNIQTQLQPSGNAKADFEFTISIKSPWTWSALFLGNGTYNSPSESCFFRLYPVDSRFIVDGLAGSSALLSKKRAKILNNLGHDASAATTAEPEAQYDPRWAQALKQDGEILETLINDCVSNHSACTPPEVMFLPSMLLQISGTVVSPSVRLVNVSNIAMRPIRYACLSYFWGGPQPWMTIASRLALYLEGIDTTSFSPTVLDSIRVTLSIGLRYLWVDAFCIVQDSSHKNLELVKMSSIYSGAVCTICVMSAQAATKGFLKPAQSVENNTIATWNVNVCDAISNQAVALEIRSDLSGLIHQSEPLLNRAWTFQEALLSPRLIMFSEGQRPTFRCSRSSLRSDGGIVSQIPRSLNYLGNVIARHQNELDPLSYKILDDWASIVKEYTGRSVTNEEDRFPALMGIVAEWENRMSLGTYCAGLWSKQIRYHLLWRPWRSISPRPSRRCPKTECETLSTQPQSAAQSPLPEGDYL